MTADASQIQDGPPAGHWVDAAPKAELHVHLEGTLEPDMLLALAHRHGVTLPWSSIDQVRAAYSFSGLEAFLPLLWQAASVLRTQQDFYDLTIGYLRRAAEDHVTRTEMFFGAQTFLDRQVPIAWQLDGVLAAVDDARSEWGIDAAVILTAQRHRDQSSALELLELTQPWAGRILGFGLGGAERSNPPATFMDYFAQARSRGFRTCCHAGEDGPADYVWQALDVCGVERIDHGVAVADDPRLVRRLVDDGVALTTCPLSNQALRVVPLSEHPLPGLLDAGVHVTVNSDDPPYFGGYVNANYRALTEHQALTDDQLRTLLRNSFAASFGEPDQVRNHLAVLEEYLDALP